jgi:hypothetical protein
MTDNRPTLDVGKFTADKPNLFDVFVGYRFWLVRRRSLSAEDCPGTGHPWRATRYVGLTWHVF